MFQPVVNPTTEWFNINLTFSRMGELNVTFETLTTTDYDRITLTRIGELHLTLN